MKFLGDHIWQKALKKTDTHITYWRQERMTEMSSKLANVIMKMDDKIPTENDSHVTNIASSYKGCECGENSEKVVKRKCKSRW